MLKKENKLINQNNAQLFTNKSRHFAFKESKSKICVKPKNYQRKANKEN